MVRATEANSGVRRERAARATTAAQPISQPRRFIAAHRATLFCTLILLLMSVALVRSLPYHTITTDETVHIPAGYANWNRHDFAPNSEHPPLAKLWATLP